MTQDTPQVGAILAYTPDQAAQALQITIEELAGWLDMPGFPAIRQGRTIRVPIAALHHWLLSPQTRERVPLAYTVVELAELLQKSPNSIYEMVAGGRIPAIKWSDRSICIPKAALEQYLVQEAFRQQQDRFGDAVPGLIEPALPLGRRVRTRRSRTHKMNFNDRGPYDGRIRDQ